MRLTRRQALKSAAGVGAACFLPWQSILAEPGKRSFLIGACDWSLGKSTDVASLDVASRIGLDGVQVSFGAPGQGADLRQEEVRQRYEEAVKKTRVTIASLAMGILNNVPLVSKPEAETYVSDCIDAMVKMNQRIVLLAFFGEGDILDPQKQDALVPILKRLAPKAEKAGVILALESYMDAESHLRLLDKVGSQAVKVYYDVCNMQVKGYPLYEDIRLLGKKGVLCEVHAKENGFLLGQGKVDFVQVRSALEDAGYSGWLILEGAVPQGGDLIESYQHNLAFLRTLFPKKEDVESGPA